MMFADLVDEVDFTHRLCGIGFCVGTEDSLAEVIQEVNTQIQGCGTEQVGRLRLLIGDLQESQGLVLPEIIESLQLIQWP